MSSLIIRPVQPGDYRSILEVYTPYVTGTNITFEYDVPSQQEFAQRIESINAQYPYLVCYAGERLLGYAYAHRAYERAAYGWVAELSVYVRQGCHGMGIGARLYGAIVEICQTMGLQKLTALISLPNPKSVALHEKLGFVPSSRMNRAGYKLGRWMDLLTMELDVGDYPIPPQPVTYVHQLPEGYVDQVCARFSASVEV